MKVRVLIPDFGMGNLHSVRRALLCMGMTPVISSCPSEVVKADKIILPGVGHFQSAMNNLKQSGMKAELDEFVLVKKKPIMGICLGMQLMATNSEEGDSEGFGWINAKVIRFKVGDRIRYKVPHIGWSKVLFAKDNQILKGLEDHSEFYFIHSYHFEAANREDILCETNYETVFSSAIAHENIFGVQFHPEKSFARGTRLLKNFLEL